MKKETFCFFGVFTILLLEVPLPGSRGQTPDDQAKPVEPIVTRAPKIGTWTVTYKYKNAKEHPTSANQTNATAKPPERITSILTEKNGTVYHQITNYTSGAKMEMWSVSGEQICRAAHGVSYIHVTEDSPLYKDFSNTDFDELSWIGMDNYKGVQDRGGKVFIFEVKNINRRPTAQEKEEQKASSGVFKELADAKGGSAQQKAKAINDELNAYLAQKFGDTSSHVVLGVINQLPIEYDDGEVIRTYEFSDKPGPSAAATEAMQELQSWKNHVKQNTVRASPP